MMLRATQAVAVATLRDLSRRPVALTGALAMLAVVIAAMRLGNPAAGVRDNLSLATELLWTTVSLATVLLAAVLAVRAVSAESGEGLPSEIAATPLSVDALVAGRAIGIAGLVTAGATGLALAALCSVHLTTPGSSPQNSLPAAVPFALLLPTALLGCGLGAFAGALAPRPLALVGVTGVILALRWAGGSVGFAAWFPDPARLDVARDLSSPRGLVPASLLLSAGAALAQSLALLMAAVAVLRVRRRRGGY